MSWWRDALKCLTLDTQDMIQFKGQRGLMLDTASDGAWEGFQSTSPSHFSIFFVASGVLFMRLPRGVMKPTPTFSSCIRKTFEGEAFTLPADFWTIVPLAGWDSRVLWDGSLQASHWLGQERWTWPCSWEEMLVFFAGLLADLGCGSPATKENKKSSENPKAY